jgi:uncharacterized circularly permuted ATP-grasp superfamily protein
MTQTAKQFFDEMQAYGGNTRAIYQAYDRWLAKVPTQQLVAKRAEVVWALPLTCMAKKMAPSA